MDANITPFQSEPIQLGDGPKIIHVGEVGVAAGNPQKTATQIVNPPKMIVYGKGWPAFEISSVTSVVSLSINDASAWTKVLSVFVINAYAIPDAGGIAFATFLFDASGNAIATAQSQMSFPCGPSSVAYPINLKGASVYNSSFAFSWGILSGTIARNCSPS